MSSIVYLGLNATLTWLLVIILSRFFFQGYRADKRRGGKTTWGNGQDWSSQSPRRQWKTEKNGGNWLWSHLLCPNDPHGCPSGLTFTWWECCSLYFWRKPAEVVHSFLFCPCVYFCLHGPFNCISFHKISRELSAFSLCSSGLISALLVLSSIYLFKKVSFSPDVIPLWLTGLKAPSN